MNNAYSYTNSSGNLDASVVNHVRQLLAQGYRIGTEHADERRFQTSSWKSCAPIQASRENEALGQLQACLNEHQGEYVRLIGIDTKAKKRVLETIIQRPGNKQPSQPSKPAPAYSNAPAPSAYTSAPSSNGPVSGGGLTPDVVNHVRQLLNQGYKIGSEHADSRRFQTSSWTSCSPVQSTREGEVMATLEACLADHPGEYVRIFGIDPKAKRRVSDLIIQRPGGKGAPAPVSRPPSYASSAAPAPAAAESRYGSPGGNRLSPEVVQQVGQLIAQGARIGLEYADERRFRTSSWQNAPAIQGRGQGEVLASLDGFLNEHSQDYVRLVGIDPKAKRRVVELVIHRPGEKTVSSPSRPTTTSSSAPASYASNGSANNGQVSGDLADQVRHLIAQSCRIGVEYADERRYKTSSWQSGTSIQSSRESDILSTLQDFMNQHSGDYVRLIGIDPKAKRRVVETIIQKPGKK